MISCPTSRGCDWSCRALPSRQLAAVFPQDVAGLGVHRHGCSRLDSARTSPRRARAAYLPDCRRRPQAARPDHPKLRDVVPVDLVERAVAPAVERAPPHQPVRRIGLLQHRVGDRHESARALLRADRPHRTRAPGRPAKRIDGNRFMTSPSRHARSPPWAKRLARGYLRTVAPGDAVNLADLVLPLFFLLAACQPGRCGAGIMRPPSTEQARSIHARKQEHQHPEERTGADRAADRGRLGEICSNPLGQGSAATSRSNVTCAPARGSSSSASR